MPRFSFLSLSLCSLPKYLKYLALPALFGTARTKEILHVNPTIVPLREEAQDVQTFIYDYDATTLIEKKADQVERCFPFKESERITWINIDGLRKSEVETVCNHFGIHQLLIEDILSTGQRPKMDEVEGVMFCLLNMLYFNSRKRLLKQNRSVLYLVKALLFHSRKMRAAMFLIRLRHRLAIANSKLRQTGS